MATKVCCWRPGHRQGCSISTDGTPEQAAEIELWARSLVPEDPGGRIWLVDEMFNGHAELVPGMTMEDIDAVWVDHGEHPLGDGTAAST